MKYVTEDGYTYHIFPSETNYESILNNRSEISQMWEDNDRYYCAMKQDIGKLGTTLYVIEKRSGSVGMIGNIDFACSLQSDCRTIDPSTSIIKIQE